MPAWEFEPSVLLGLAVWTAAYAMAAGPIQGRLAPGAPVSERQQVAFHTGTFLAFIALLSPLDTLGDHSLFTANMAQHILLTFAAAPLWVWGAPGWLLRRLGSLRLFRFLTHPLVAFTIFAAAMWGWHLPSAYDAALKSQPLHIFEHSVFIASSLIGWLPALKPAPEGGLNSPIKLVYLVPSLFSCTALAALITLAPNQLYSFYGNAAVQWGLEPLVDQQLGGMIMWLPGDTLYLLLILWAFKTWLDQPDAHPQQVRQ